MTTTDEERHQIGEATYAFRPPARICSIEGCPEKHKARGLCKVHYERWLVGGDARPDRPIGHHARGHGRVTCECEEPAPDVNGECMNRGCRRPFFSPEYQAELQALIAGGILTNGSGRIR